MFAAHLDHAQIGVGSRHSRIEGNHLLETALSAIEIPFGQGSLALFENILRIGCVGGCIPTGGGLCICLVRGEHRSPYDDNQCDSDS